jgi:hypothetical protein
MASLLVEVVEAHGGLARWNELYLVRARLIQGGEFWGMTGHGGELTDVVCTARLHEQEVSHEPFNGQNLRSRYTADRVSIDRTDGTEVEALENPRASFTVADPGAPWTDLQLVYFVGTSMWTYLTQPFTYTLPGFETVEIEPWTENGEQWRRLRITWPEQPVSHSKVQTLYVGDDGLIRRFDYEIDIAGASKGAHYITGYSEIAGIMTPNMHTILLRDDKDQSMPEPVMVTIGVEEVDYMEF